MNNIQVTTLDDQNNGPTDGTSLREAIATATPGDTITFANSGTINLTLGQLNIATALTIDGDVDGDGTADITISGNNTSRIFNINDETANEISVNLSGLTITGGVVTGFTDGGGIFNSENLTLTNSTLSGNSAGDFGGGIYNNGGTVTLSSSTLSGNSAFQAGGIYNNGGTVSVTNSTSERQLQQASAVVAFITTVATVSVSN
ncbi:MAG: hypothetical protein HC890_10210, partial [Chloroflexaceae bacterium]|nr:hypothetical protein [Chloroflexaceae bacterium]